jgi:predicted transcriptional regulator
MPGYPSVVSIELPGSVEEQLRTLAESQGRDVSVLVEEAVRQYLEAAAITDLDANAVADAQAALLGELPHIPDWKTGDA